jgi:sortase A
MASPEPAPSASGDAVPEAKPDRLGRLAALAGKVLIGAGVVVLLFAAFQLYGTDFLQRQHQATLRSSFEAELKGTTPTTLPVSAGPPVTLGPGSSPNIGDPIANLLIPVIGLDQIVVEGTGEPQLQQGPGHYTQTPLPGQAGNVAIAGHRTTWGHPFYSLDALIPGDKIYLVTASGTFTYTVTGSQNVAPTDLAVLDPTRTPTLTLTTCTPRYSAAQRLVVTAVLTRSATASPSSTTSTLPTPARQKRNAAAPQAGSSHSWLPSILLGMLTAALFGATMLLARRIQPRWALYLAGGTLSLIALLLFFSAISQILPASI